MSRRDSTTPVGSAVGASWLLNARRSSLVTIKLQPLDSSQAPRKSLISARDKFAVKLNADSIVKGADSNGINGSGISKSDKNPGFNGDSHSGSNSLSLSLRSGAM